jgi:hydroxyethylthiazole kinase-like uncharacterized protein yjeF
MGPGLGTAPATVSAVKKFLKNHKKPLILDADALNILSLDKDILNYVPAGSILTPHEKEFERLNGPWTGSPGKFEQAKKFAARYGIILVLKGANTLVTDGKNMYFNSTGTPALAKAGTGDVLTGMITGFAAQGISFFRAAVTGVFYHGLLAERFVARYNTFSLSPLDLIDAIPRIDCKKPEETET